MTTETAAETPRELQFAPVPLSAIYVEDVGMEKYMVIA
jgi:hypothetical protein